MPKSASPESTVSTARWFRIASWIGLLVIATAGSLAGASALTRRPLPGGVHSPTLAIELMQPPTTLGDILLFADETGPRSQEERAIRRGIQVDFLFIASYVAFFSAIGMILFTQRRRSMGLVLVAVAIGAGVVDIFENRAMLAVLGGATDVSPRMPSLFKWTLVFVAFGLASIVMIDRDAKPFRRWVGYLAAIVGLFGVAEGLYGVVAGEAALLEAGFGRMTLVLPLAEIFLSTRHVFRDGVRAALDRLAAKRVFKVLADWPSPDSDETVGLPIRVERS